MEHMRFTVENEIGKIVKIICFRILWLRVVRELELMGSNTEVRGMIAVSCGKMTSLICGWEQRDCLWQNLK